MEQAADIKPWQRLTVRFGKILFTLLLAWLMALLVWLIIAPEPLYLKAPAKGGSNRTSFESAGAGAYHVFGEVGVAEVVEVKTVDAPDTRLRLSLLGVTQASVEEESSAIIARKGSGGDFYRIGDVVEGRTRLAAVYKDKVIIDTAGKLETLKFDEVSSAGVGVASQIPERSESPDSDDRAKSLRERFSRVRSTQDFMMVASEAAQQDPAEMLSGLGLESQGSGSGYKVTAGSILTQVDLKPGDIVLSVNGQPLGDASSDSSLLEQVMSEGSAQIEVQRGNSRFMVNQSFGLRN